MKLSVIGAGSTYTPELIDGILRRRDRLPVTEVALVDPNGARTDVMGPLVRRMIDRAGGGIDVSWGDDLDDGVRDASFVVSQFRVGGQEARHRDELLGREFGIIGQETVGIGGFAKAIRTVPVALGVARAIERNAPDAFLLNFTNPAGLVTEALTRHVPDVKTIGLCNVPWNIASEVADGLKVPVGEIGMDYVGLNHLSWVRRFSVGEDDVTERVLREFRAELGKQVVTDDEPQWTAESMALLDAMPNYYLLYYLETHAMVGHQATHPTRASEVIEIERRLYERYADITLTEKPAELMERGGAYYSDAAAALMADIASDAGTTHIVNTRNNGAIPDLPADVVIEVPAVITAAGAAPRSTSALRKDVHALVTTVKDYELLTIEAIVEGDADKAQLALLTNPLGPDLSALGSAWRRLREVHSGLLGALDG